MGDCFIQVLNLATEHSDNPDLRDRGYIYWRLLSSDPEAARAVVLSQKPEIGDDTFSIEPTLLDELMQQIATLASIYHKPPEAFVMKSLHVTANTEDEEEVEVEEEPLGADGEESFAAVDAHHEPTRSQATGKAAPAQQSKSGGGDLLDLLDDVPAPAPAVSAQAAPPSVGPSIKKVQVVTAEAGQGVFISSAMVRNPATGQITLELDVGNATSTAVNALAIQLNKNTFGFAPVSPQISLPRPVLNGSVASFSLPLVLNPQLVNPQDVSLNLQSAVKNIATGGVFYFIIPVYLEVLFKTVPIDVQAFAAAWKAFDESQEVSVVVPDLPTVDIEAIKSKLAAKDVVFVAKRDIPGQVGQVSVFFSVNLVNNQAFFVELKFKAGLNVCKVVVRSPNKAYSELVKTTVARLVLQG